ncbi:glycosyltransferase [Dyella ginsengisoli]|uniref:glycosyltransferase n=1 Tax=Dyella ginsengisoli TaxID=363848 RepID=UPI0009FE89DF|nr:glycosyltransferase family 4 protein [Dyella ginsengisoli]
MNIMELKVRLVRWLLAYVPSLYALLTGRCPPSSGANMHVALKSVRERAHPRVLIVDHDFPELSRDAGSKAIFQLVELIRQHAEVTFWCATTSPSKAGRDLLAAIGVKPANRTFNCDLDRWLHEHSPEGEFVAAVLSRPIVAAIYLGSVRKHVSGVCAYYGHDIHYMRLAQMSRFVVRPGLRSERRELSRIEGRLWSSFDVVFYPSEEEASLVNAFRSRHALSPNTIVLPLWEAPSPPLDVNRPDSRCGILFVGSFEHPPNIDGLDWFFSDVLPLVRSAGCNDHVYVAGSNMDRYRPPTDDLNVSVLGRIDEHALVQLYEKVRVSVAPLRFGAGVKGKVIESLGFGLPCVTTSVGLQGLGWARPAMEPHDTPEGFAAALISLLSDDDLWNLISSECLRLLAITYAPGTIRDRLCRSLSI